ncbi:MAG: hypothetical protein FWB73_08425 [Treponema sp.]|nr:hypothetical protein [Treponema sp.]
MAIAPIDLQALFSQVEKVGKAQAAAKDGQVIHQAILGEQIQKKTDEQLRQINEAQNLDEGQEKINDRTNKQKHEGKNKNSERKENEPDDENKNNSAAVQFRDPNLGNRIDIRQ